MSDTSSLLRIQKAQGFVQLLGQGDVQRAAEMLAERVVYRSPGANAVSGEFVGRDEVLHHLSELAARFTAFHAVKWEDWLVGEHHVGALAVLHIQTEGRSFQGRVIFLARFDVDDQIIELTIFYEDQAAIDRFLGP